MRKLASIQKILNVRPIDGADKIEVVDVLGWSVVVKKDDGFKPGDMCVYFEIDSFLSANDPRYASFEDRFSNWGTKRGMRLKTIKLRKQISQGLVLKVDNFPEIKNPQEGDNLTDLLNIEKWESLADQIENSGGSLSKNSNTKPFPSFIRKTDQNRVQNYIGVLHQYKDHTFEVTIKLDGSSMTVFRVDNKSPIFNEAWYDIESRMLRKKSKLGKLWYRVRKALGIADVPNVINGVCSRNIQLDVNGNNHFSEYVRGENIIERLDALGRNIAIQGELIAPSIQKNYEKVNGFEFYVYDIFDIDTQEYLLPTERRELVDLLGLNHIPIIYSESKILDFVDIPVDDVDAARIVVDSILKFAEGPGMNQGVKREGVVFKSNTKDFSFKAISQSYLLAKKD